LGKIKLEKNDWGIYNDDEFHCESTDINSIILKLCKLVDWVHFIENNFPFYSDKIDDYGILTDFKYIKWLCLYKF